ncbi:MAG: hypothetical protein K2Q18_04915, partial [Bdellovibrionales bacterium]|nr:hypothetical protein [Bdellovibrionales bacterium]
MALVLFSLIFATSLYAQELPRIQFDTYRNATDSLSVVEVLGSVRGSGVLVLLDGKIVIVTNSHNLQGNDSAMVTLPRRFSRYFILEPIQWKEGNIGFQGMAKVLHDFPLSDVAILSLPEENMSLEQKALIFEYARTNGGFFRKEGWIAGQRSLDFGDSISAVLKGQPTQIQALEGFKGSKVPDTFISGDGEPIWVIPVFAKPGVSGGAYYQGGILTGLVTKISLAGEPVAFATPFTKIAKLLYSADNHEKLVSWENGLMVYKGKDKTVTMNPLGNGWIGNGGELT